MAEKRKIAPMARAKQISKLWGEKLYRSTVPLADPMRVGYQLDSELMPHGHEPDEIRRWIKAITRRFDITPTHLAKKAGLAQSTINRFVKGNGPNLNVTATTINALVKAAGEIGKEKISEGIVERAGEIDSEEYLLPLSQTTILSAPVIGRVEAGLYQESVEWPKEEWYSIQAPVPRRYARKPVVALVVQGHSMDLVYPEGTVVVCVPFYALDRSPYPGERVVVSRRDRHGGVESTVKEYQVDAKGNSWLVPLSSHAEHQNAIPLGQTVHDDPARDDDLFIPLLVVGSFRPEPETRPYGIRNISR